MLSERIARDIRDSIAVKEAVLKDRLGVIEKAANIVADCVRKGHKLLFFGNGGSASDSQHLAAEFVGRYEKERRALPAIALTTDTSILTAVANDYGFERIFERQIEALGQKGDVALAFSTSGNSPNVLLAIDRARAMGLYTIGFTGKDGGKIKEKADLAFVVPSQKTSRIQETHILVGHIICERVDELL
jgi:D-sedoheptulose 7-phosphate isomerase